MRRLLALLTLAAATASAQQPFTLQQILSAPYALSLTAAPVGNHFAWVENAEGRRNIWIAAPGEPAHQLTHYTEDDGQDLSSVTWSPDATQIAYARGAENGSSGKPANPAHLQRPTPVEIFIQPTAGGEAIKLGEGHSPLFTRDGKSVIFLRSGQIFITRIPPAKPATKTSPEQQGLLDGVLGLIGSIPTPDTAKQLVYDRGSASQLTLSPDGKLLAYVSHRRSGDHAHTFIGLYNFETKTLTFPSPSTGDDSAPIFSPDGKSLAWLRFPNTDAPEFATNRVYANPWSIQLSDLATNTTRTVFSPEPNKPGSAEPRMSTGEPYLIWAPTNRIIFFSEQNGYVQPHIVAISGGAPRDLIPSVGELGQWQETVEIEDAVLSKDGKSLIYSSAGAFMNCVSHGTCNRNVPILAARDIRTIWKIDIDNAKGPSLSDPLTPGNVIATHPVQLADGTLAALVSSAQYPMHAAVVIPKKVNYVDELLEPTPLHPSVFPNSYPAKDLVEPLRVVLNSKGTEVTNWHWPFDDATTQVDTDHIHGQLFLPPGVSHYVGQYDSNKHPAIIFVHGGPRRQMLLGYPGMDYYSNAYAMNQYLASRGYIVLSVNYRSGIGYGLNFRQCEHCGADGAAEYNDVLAAAAYLRSRPDVDSAHIGIWGGSYGGYLTALALARNSDIFAAGVDFHGVHEWSLEDNAKADWLRGSLAEQEKIAATAHASSPMADIAKWHSPILLIHGDDDPEVAYAQTPTLADALRARDVHVEELIFPDEVHDFILHKDWLAAYQATADFFVRTLKPRQNPVK